MTDRQPTCFAQFYSYKNDPPSERNPNPSAKVSPDRRNGFGFLSVTLTNDNFWNGLVYTRRLGQHIARKLNAHCFEIVSGKDIKDAGDEEPSREEYQMLLISIRKIRMSINQSMITPIEYPLVNFQKQPDWVPEFVVFQLAPKK